MFGGLVYSKVLIARISSYRRESSKVKLRLLDQKTGRKTPEAVGIAQNACGKRKSLTWIKFLNHLLHQFCTSFKIGIESLLLLFEGCAGPAQPLFFELAGKRVALIQINLFRGQPKDFCTVVGMWLTLSAGTAAVATDLENLSEGLYWVRLTTGAFNGEPWRLVKLK